MKNITTPADLDLVPKHSPARRRWLMGAVAGVATVGGVGLGWRGLASQAPATSAEVALWGLELKRLDGSLLRLTTLRGKPLVVNFWATWCPPCVEELPILSRFYQENSSKGWQVIGLAVDQLDAVKRFLVKNPVTFTVAMAGMPGLDIAKVLGNLSAALPFTVVLGADSRIAHRKMGRLVADDLRAWAKLA